MLLVKNLSYALFIVFIGSFLMIIANGAGSVQKNDIEAHVISSSSSLQENSNFLIMTGRRELNGFKGYRNYRRGYRKYSDNWWYPEIAFATYKHLDAKHVPLKEISALKRTPLIYPLEERKPWMLKQHIDSCMARYRSYNQSDNSYQPFHGPRRQCFSHIFKESKMKK
ncbi:BA14K family protein [Bartonella sp. B35(2025)]